ncbi:hypothetical protein Sjap_012607 [Stephania japonica]|uniref:Exostosin GT47 domain-containing protein n=1 Tax=Stephania japonica TaxID=461633 RepID=A0AAP0IX29_9MAGN
MVCSSFRGFFYIPTTLALITSLYIVLYISSTSHIFSAHQYYKPHFLIKSPHGSSNFSFQSHNFVKPPDYRPPRNDLLVPELVQPIKESSFNEGSAEVSWPPEPPESESLFVGSNGKHVNKEVFHDKEIFLEDYKEMNGSFKIYVYPHREDDPFAHVFSPVDSEPGGNYASESYYKMVLMKSHFITKDPSEADLFFMPFSITRLRHDPRVSVGGIPDFVKSYVYNITQNYPYWNRSGGADHFYVACHSVGRSAMDKAEEVKYNSIQVVCSSNYYLSGYIAHKDVSMPQIWTRNGDPPEVNLSARKTLAFFAGSMNSPVRAKLIETWRNDSKIFVNSGRLKTPYSDAMLGSKFCLHVKGYTKLEELLSCSFHRRHSTTEKNSPRSWRRRVHNNAGKCDEGAKPFSMEPHSS